MTLDDVVRMADLVEESRSPSEDGTKLGCDCGCGGDSWDYEDWEEAHNDAEECHKELVRLMDKFGIEGAC